MADFATPLVFPLGGDALSVATEADVWAQDMLSVQFALPMKNDEFLQSVQAYTITPTNGGGPVDVTAVLTGNLINPTLVFLVVTVPQIGSTYSINFQNLYGVTGSVLTPSECEFIGRLTKEDSVINSRPQMYDMNPTSTLRWLQQAIAREDDLIGGSRKDRFLKF